MFCHCTRSILPTCIFLLLTATVCLAEVRVVDTPATATSNSNYVGNRVPLLPSSFVKLPIGSIAPHGWLRRQLELEKDGMVGHLAEISPWLDFAKSSWADKQGRGHFGWEELPYWLKGYGDLGYVLKDKAIIAQARKWIRAAMDSQRDDGWFGPRESLTSLDGKPDLWPHMLMLNILQSYQEATGDPRAIEVMTRFMKWENTLPDNAFGEGYWPKLRPATTSKAPCGCITASANRGSWTSPARSIAAWPAGTATSSIGTTSTSRRGFVPVRYSACSPRMSAICNRPSETIRP